MMKNIREKYLRDMVYGSMDGIITTFAIVSGVMGAGLSYGVIIILGFANLVADGISMAVGNYTSTKSEIERIEKKKREYGKRIKENPDLQAKKLVDALCGEGFKTESAEMFAKEIASDPEVWETVLIRRRFGDFERTDPRKTALATFFSFVVAGFIPVSVFLLHFFWPGIQPYAFHLSIVFTGLALFVVGLLKGHIVEKPPFKSGLETLSIGALAALAAFVVGVLLKGLAG